MPMFAMRGAERLRPAGAPPRPPPRPAFRPLPAVLGPRRRATDRGRGRPATAAAPGALAARSENTSAGTCTGTSGPPPAARLGRPPGRGRAGAPLYRGISIRAYLVSTCRPDFTLTPRGPKGPSGEAGGRRGLGPDRRRATGREAPCCLGASGYTLRLLRLHYGGSPYAVSSRPPCTRRRRGFARPAGMLAAGPPPLSAAGRDDVGSRGRAWRAGGGAFGRRRLGGRPMTLHGPGGHRDRPNVPVVSFGGPSADDRSSFRARRRPGTGSSRTSGRSRAP